MTIKVSIEITNVGINLIAVVADQGQVVLADLDSQDEEEESHVDNNGIAETLKHLNRLRFKAKLDQVYK